MTYRDKIEKFAKENGYELTNKSVADSFISDCQFWYNESESIYVSNYDVTINEALEEKELVCFMYFKDGKFKECCLVSADNLDIPDFIETVINKLKS